MSEIKLLQGDCLELINEIPDGSVDLVLTDPPYCVGTTSNGHKGSYTDNNLIKPFFDILFKEAAASGAFNTDTIKHFQHLAEYIK